MTNIVTPRADRNAPASSPAASVTSRRNHLFDLLRILFALGVLLAHSYELHDGNRRHELFNRLTHTGMSLGEVGVDGFFLLSGYLIVMSWNSRPQLGTFLQKRVLRIVPGYMVAAVLSTVVVGLVAPGVPGWFAHFPWRTFLSSILTLNFPEANPVYPGKTYGLINGALWTIAYEFRCYLIVAIAGLAGVFRRPWIWLVATILAVVGFFFEAQLLPHAWPHGTFIIGTLGSDLRLTPVFLLGGCFYLFRQRIPFRTPWALLAGAFLVAAALWAKPHFELAFVLCFGYLLFFAGPGSAVAFAGCTACPISPTASTCMAGRRPASCFGIAIPGRWSPSLFPPLAASWRDGSAGTL